MNHNRSSDLVGSLTKPLACAAIALALLLPPIVASAAPSAKHFQADLTPLNASIGGGASGTASLTVNGDTLIIDVTVKGLSQGMHMMHIHGFTMGDKAASCATATQDKNDDGSLILRKPPLFQVRPSYPSMTDPRPFRLRVTAIPRPRLAARSRIGAPCH